MNAPILHMFGRMAGVATDVDLLEHLTPRQLRRAVETGLFATELPGVRRLAGTKATVESRVLALSLYARELGFVSGMTAAREAGVECVPREYLELTVHEQRSPVLPSWVKVMRSSWHVADDRQELADGRVISKPLRTLFRCASTTSAVRFEKIAEQMWNKKLITPAEAAEYLQRIRRSGRGGVARFELWLEKAVHRPLPSQSGLEVDLITAVIAAGLPDPVRQHPLVLPGGELIHVDAAWPDVRLGLEPGHTFWHSGDEKLRRDHQRDRACDELGWRILRFDEVELRDLHGCARQVVSIHRMRRSR